MSSPSTGRFDSPLARTPSRGSQGSATPGTSSRSSKTVLGDKYVLGEELGRGAFGQVRALPARLMAHYLVHDKGSLAGTTSALTCGRRLSNSAA